MTDTRSARSPSAADGSWYPVLMSVAIYPGIGQWMQRRQTAGTLYFAFFTLLAGLFAWTFYLYMSEVIPLLRQALAGELEEGASIPPLMNIIKPFGVVLFIYIGNVVDVLRGRYQVREAQRAEG